MKPPQIEVKSAFGAIKIYIGGILHVHLFLDGFVGLQSWREIDKFCIEYTSVGNVILTEYDSFEKWSTILKQIDQFLGADL